MEKPTSHPLIFSAHYAGNNTFPYNPISTSSGSKRYVGYFMNDHGDKWIFIYDAGLGGGVLLGSDCDWAVIPLGNGDKPVVGTVLSTVDDESLWLYACWIASAWLRRDEKDNSVPKDALTVGAAAVQWRIRPTIIKNDITEDKLAATKLGNVWVLTPEVMLARYGKPRTEIPISLEFGKEIDQLEREDTEWICQKLMGQ